MISNILLLINIIILASSQEQNFTKSKYRMETRIIGGEKSFPGNFPSQVALFKSLELMKKIYCGGTLISPKFVLTAAHCLVGKSRMIVAVGLSDLRNINLDNYQRFVSFDLKPHENYTTKPEITNDIGLIQLPQMAILNDHVKLQILPNNYDKGNTYEGETGIITGWGRTSDDSESSTPELRYVSVKIISNKFCDELSPVPHMNENKICTSGSGIKGGCLGDSGGPLIVNGVQVGIVSYLKKQTCIIGIPTVFTRITSFLEWIEINTNLKETTEDFNNDEFFT